MLDRNKPHSRFVQFIPSELVGCDGPVLKRLPQNLIRSNDARHVLL